MNLQILTFVRPGELRMGLWHEIDFKNAVWRIPAERMKMKRAHLVPLAKQTIETLEKLKEITGCSEYMFPSLHGSHKPISDVTLTKVLRTIGYTGKAVVPHGFRHTASTVLNEHRFDYDVIERQLAHVEKNKIRGIYNHAEYLDERRTVMQWYADHLDTLKASYTPEQYLGCVND